MDGFLTAHAKYEFVPFVYALYCLLPAKTVLNKKKDKRLKFFFIYSLRHV